MTEKTIAAAAADHGEWANTAANRSAKQRGSRVLASMLAGRGQPAAEIEAILADHPRSMFAHRLRMARIVRDDDRGASAAAATSIDFIRSVGADACERARRHAEAAAAWLEHDPLRAVERYGAIVATWPHDVLALAAAHALDFRLGQRRMLRDRIGRALRHWDTSSPNHAAVLAMYAFGLEENGAYRRAERAAARALALDPKLAPAIHVIAHVMEMEGRAEEGIAFLAANEAAWREGSSFSIHIAWHRALLHLRLNDATAALALYDQRIATAPASLAALADASALLWRLQLREIELGRRWSTLAARWEDAVLEEARPFFAIHAVMAFAAAGRVAAVKRVLGTLPRIDASAAARLGLPDQALAMPVCTALSAFAAGDYAACISSLERVRQIARSCGGSVAQCDLLELTFAEAVSRAPKSRPHKIAA